MRTVRRKRRAATVVEFAVVVPLLILLLFAIIEVGYTFMVRHSIATAAREGARAAAMPNANMGEVNTAVNDAMARPGLTGFSVTTNLTTLSDTDTVVWVEVAMTVNRGTFTGNMLGGGLKPLSSRAYVRREGV